MDSAPLRPFKPPALLNRERAAQSYRVSAYYFSKVFTELPFRAAAIFLFAAVTYWPAQFQRNVAKYFLFIVICLSEFVAMNAVGIVVSGHGVAGDRGRDRDRGRQRQRQRQAETVAETEAGIDTETGRGRQRQGQRQILEQRRAESGARPSGF